MLDPHYFHIAGEKYLTAIADASGCIPVIIPLAVMKQRLR
jgi:hypothetical protein